MSRLLFCISLISFLSSLWLNTAHGVDIKILDCDGVTRASKSIDGLEKQDIELKVQDAAGQPADGTQVSLTNTETGQVVSVTSKQGVATFPELNAGTWVASSSASGVTLTGVSIATAIPMTVAAGAIAGATVVSGGAVYGTTEGVIAISDSIENNSDNSSDDQDDDNDPNPSPTPSPSPEEPCDCDPDEEAEELDDFFNAKISEISPFS